MGATTRAGMAIADMERRCCGSALFISSILAIQFWKSSQNRKCVQALSPGFGSLCRRVLSIDPAGEWRTSDLECAVRGSGKIQVEAVNIDFIPSQRHGESGVRGESQEGAADVPRVEQRVEFRERLGTVGGDGIPKNGLTLTKDVLIKQVL